MKAYIKPAGLRFTILTILTLLLLSACSLTRKLKDNQALVRHVKIKGVDKEFDEAAYLYIDKAQQPNNWLNLQFYLTFSKNGKRNIGEAPSVLDSNLVEYSRLQIQKFLRNKGYLKAKVTDSVAIKNKRASLTFTAEEGPLFHIRKFQDSIADPNVRKLYRTNRSVFSHIQPGGRFDTDSLAYDRDEFYLVMRRNGYFDFVRPYITFNYDSTFNASVVDLKVIISNPIGKASHPVYTINNTFISVTNSNGRTTGKADTVQVDSQLRFVDYSHKFKPKIVKTYTFQKKGELYDVDKQTLTTSRLSELNVFRNVPNPTYTKLPDSTHRLDVRLDMIPLKQMTDRVEGEVLFSGGRYGYNIGNTFTNRNLFKGAEILQIKTNWSILFDNNRNSANSGGIENQDFKIGGSLSFPGIISPFKLPVLGKYGVPHTTFSSNYELFYQKDLVTRQSWINSLTYDWAETSRKLHSFTPISIEFSRGTIVDSARAALERYNRYSYIYLIGRTVFTLGSQYTYQLNANKLNSLDDFTYFRGFIDLGGNTLSLASKLLNFPKDTLGQRKFLGYTFSQYTKLEGDIRWYRHLGGEQQLILRVNPGIGIPYGNSRQLVFEKNFYAGGASDMRAWLPRTLGPGQFNRASFYNNSSDLNRFKYLDQFGEIKFISNAEYRYKIANDFFGSKLKGAFFADFGNVWRLNDSTARSENGSAAIFKFNNFFKSSAMDIGAGFRLDLTFFVFRLDAAFKFKDPQFSGSDQWVMLNHFGELFSHGTFKDNYYRDNQERYHYMQLNFGIGLPF
ncbi:translocation and assembly module lipoprotein TamL [Mucilaginibacter sp. KACC 22063]|uniref:translocation and assembly module lipoprotein TamL n=1 Tax=Mucilaginibacter sp. KACC 22063 TaxID=3025666 RepID=UPI00236694BF|nr:BamA/TamA family outer membrane protein [Mucilaginibacter sp. KACC 22063]WDF56913.1 BamA/TamA family outer membrane protein [Mucilaginibacter sp. KACC 22063]